MRVLLRADASVQRGTGHVMRCLTLAEALVANGHDVELVGAIEDIPWLRVLIERSGVAVVPCDPDELDGTAILARQPDWLVVDSYTIASEAISRANTKVPVLAIVDGDSRGIVATLYLDQNLGAERVNRPTSAGRYLLGSRFALVRDSLLERRRSSPWHSAQPPRVLAIMGGTDPTGSIVEVTRAILAAPSPVDLTVVAAEEFRTRLAALPRRWDAALTVASPTPDLPELLGSADIVVSAAGTSAWDVCTLGIPAVFVAIVDNQRESLARLVEDRAALGIDVVGFGENEFARISQLVESLVTSEPLRKELSGHAMATFDGRGKQRVVDELVRASASIREKD